MSFSSRKLSQFRVHTETWTRTCQIWTTLKYDYRCREVSEYIVEQERLHITIMTENDTVFTAVCRKTVLWYILKSHCYTAAPGGRHNKVQSRTKKAKGPAMEYHVAGKVWWKDPTILLFLVFFYLPNTYLSEFWEDRKQRLCPNWSILHCYTQVNETDQKKA